MSDNDLQAALLDVRKAYRLLYGFHRRIFDMARVIDGVLPGYEFQLMRPFNKSISAKWKPQRKTTDYWEALPFYSTDFVWSKTAAESQLLPTDRIFGISVFADNAWGGEDDDFKLAPEEFNNTVEEATTVAYLCLGKPVKMLSEVTVEDAWTEIGGAGEMKPVASDDGNFVYVPHEIDLVSVPTKAALTEAVMSFLRRAEALLGN